ncbi:XRE family transcriptional regulator [Fulvivirga sediminis]|uniref:Helix-turn-helix domain-containing protein n=1 Tax=Fulvivirga sediminis TaxID=2803949 RepID=A0A937F8L1_9BACT|nr:helix-turn-helix domain-containing protein [Fulvivirga sediminis]MBL3658472.1 helix-turn-helix domain-containing protein [Fulvivirga sediminis]
MSLISDNIKYLRKKMGVTQEQFSEQLGIKRSLLGAYEEGRADPRISNLIKMAQLFGTSVDILINKDVSKLSDEELIVSKFKRGKEVLAITVNEEQKENIELVPQKAAAGYLNGYADPEYIKELPKFNLPILSTGTYRAFEITGDSMLPILPGTIIIGQYIDDIRDIKNGKTYILVTQNDGIVYKRVFNYLEDTGKLFLVSDNRQYAPYQISGDEVLEIWASKAYISVQFPDADDSKDVSTEQLASIVLELQKEIVKLKEEKK